jgi:hypothetical protein
MGRALLYKTRRRVKHSLPYGSQELTRYPKTGVSTKLCMYCICSDIYEIVHISQKLFDKSFPGRIKAENPKLKLLSRI